MTAPLLISVVHYVVCAVGMTSNLALLGIILFKTPRSMKSYSILLFSQTLLQAITCITSCIIFVRLIPHDVTAFLVMSGVGRFFCSYQVVFYLYSIMFHGHAHYCIMLAVCFAYRLFVLLYSTPSVRAVFIAATLIYLPTPAIFVWFANSTIYDHETAIRLLATWGPEYNFSHNELVTAVVNIYQPSAITGIIWIMAPGIPACLVMVFTGRKMLRILSSTNYMSHTTRSAHREIIKGLILQAFLATLYTFSCGTFFVGLFDIYRSATMEYGTHMAGELCTMISPLLNLYFVIPYRRTVTSMLRVNCSSMSMAAPIIVTTIHYLVCSIGSVANFGLLGVILFRTPSNMKSYAILLFSKTLLQALTCISSGIVFMRIIPQDLSTFLVMSGVGPHFCSHRVMFYLYSVMLHGHAHYCIMLAICFSYRLYVIMHPIPRLRVISAAVALIYLPTLIIFAWFATSTLYDQEIAKQLLLPRGQDYTFTDSEIVTGVVNLMEPSVICGIFWIMAPSIPAYVVMFITARIMIRVLAFKAKNMSQKTRTIHREIVKGLFLQAYLPTIYTFSCGTFLVGQLNIFQGVAIEYATHMAAEFIVMISPFITLYYVKPYRRSVRRFFLQDNNSITISKIQGLPRMSIIPSDIQMRTSYRHSVQF